MSGIRLRLFSDIRRVATKVASALATDGVRSVLIIDAASPVRKPRHGVFGKLCAERGCEVSVCDPLTEPLPDLAAFDAVYMPGGNPFRLLAAARKSGLRDALLRVSVRPDGVCVLAASAGAMVLGTDLNHIRGLVPEAGLRDLTGFGWVPSRVMPHMDKRGPFYDVCRERVKTGVGPWVLLNECDFLEESPVLVRDPLETPGLSD